MRKSRCWVQRVNVKVFTPQRGLASPVRSQKAKQAKCTRSSTAPIPVLALQPPSPPPLHPPHTLLRWSMGFLRSMPFGISSSPRTKRAHPG